MSNMAMWQ